MRREVKRQVNRAAVHARRGGLVLFALFFVSFVLLILSRLENNLLHDARGHVSDAAAPVLEWASLPAVYVRRGWHSVSNYITLYDELDRLRQQNEQLKQWEWRAQRMERRLSHMRALLNAVDEQALDQATGRVIADARGPFVRSMLVNVGRNEGVKKGYAVINGDGLVGRTVHVGENAARVILLNDLNSRVPVLVGPSAVRAVLVGDNTSAPRLEFLTDNAEVFKGDEVYTSGDAGLLPRGLRIGEVAEEGKHRRVNTYATLSELEFVSVLFFDSPLVIANDTPPVSDAATESAQGPESVQQASADDKERPQKR